MIRTPRPIHILVYYDVLCAWCFVARERLERIREELGAAAKWRYRPFALRVQDSVPTSLEIESWREEIQRARREPEGQTLSPELWMSADPPRSSLPALAAVEAAKLQGPDYAEALMRTLQRAALEQGINVSRPDTLLEFASRLGLNMNRFTAAWQSPHTRRLILQEHRLAAERGVNGVPAVVIHGRWMLAGLKELSEYRENILQCVEKIERLPEGMRGQTFH